MVVDSAAVATLGARAGAAAPPAPAAIDPALLAACAPRRPPRVIVAGFGRVGQTVAALLEVHGVPYVAIDRDPDRVARSESRARRCTSVT